MVRGLAEIVMFRQRRYPVHRGKSRAIEHFREASFARITSQIRQALIPLTRLFAQEHRGFFFRQAHALEEQAFLRQRSQVSNRKHGIFQVVEQPETENEIETAQFGNRAVLNVALAKGICGNPGTPPPRFPRARRNRIHSIRTPQASAKETNAASRIHGIREPQHGLQPGDHAAERFAARFDQFSVLPLIEGCQLDRSFGVRRMS